MPRQITLVSAPAGFGKTTAVVDWLENLDANISWLTLDADDDNPRRFFAYFISALHRLDEDIGGEIFSIILSGQAPPAEIISTTLVNDLLALEERGVLVVDDFHVIQDEIILDTLEKIVTHLPSHLHLVIITREDPPFPLARLRANNQLTEIRAADLRFNQEDTGDFFNRLMGHSLSSGSIEILQDRTEGWVVGLQLASLSMSEQKDPTDFIERLSGSHRFILDYLTEEVISHQPADVRQFLLQTSILDQLNADLCNTVAERDDSQAMLEQLLSANLFLIPLDHEGDWFRYHHLFADLLRSQHKQLHANQIIVLHQRASQWFAAHDFINDAVEHAIAAQDYDLAMALIEEHAMEMLMQWHAKAVRRWLEILPPEMGLATPRTNFAFAWMHLLAGEFQNAIPYIEHLRILFTDPDAPVEDTSLQAEWFALQAMMLNAQGNAHQSLQASQQALDLVEESNGHLLSLIYMSRADAYRRIDDHVQAMQAYEEIIHYGRLAKNLVMELLGVSGLGLLVIHHGNLHQAYELTTDQIQRIERSGVIHPISAAVYGEQGVVHYHWFQLDDALGHFLRSMQVSKLSGYSDAELYQGIIISRLHEMKGDLPAAVAQFEKVLKLMKEEAPTAVREEIVAQHVRLRLSQDDLGGAKQVIMEYDPDLAVEDQLPRLPDDSNIPYARGQVYCSILRIALYQARRYGSSSWGNDSIQLADMLLQWASQNEYVPLMIDTALLRAQIYAEIGDLEKSTSDYLLALRTGEPEGFISLFVEVGPPARRAFSSLSENNQLGEISRLYVEKILAAFDQVRMPDTRNIAEPPHLPSSGEDEFLLVEPLTDREVDVLKLMSQGLKYQEIADSLYISLNTVRFYVKSMYGKLGVNNRVKAISRAQEHQII